MRKIISTIFLMMGIVVMQAQDNKQNMENVSLETAIFGGGCFWCIEAIFERIDGVESATSGYAGGHKINPTYKEVCTGTTGHAEVVEVKYNPQKVSYLTLLEVFFKMHDPTTKDRQGEDVGSQYRSVIFYTTTEQKKLADQIIHDLTQEGIYERPIVTTVVPYVNFYPAEDYHQGYYDENPEQGYCKIVITPKVDKFEKVFKDLIKK